MHSENIIYVKVLARYTRICINFSKKTVAKIVAVVKENCSVYGRLHFFAVLCVVCEGLYLYLIAHIHQFIEMYIC